LLPTGEVLCSTCTNDIQVYRPDGSPNPAWAPSFVSPPTTVVPGTTFTLQGRQLNGLSQANSYGDDAQMATNFPLVRIESGAQVFYCRTHGFSTMGVATGGAVTSAKVDVPHTVPLGPATLCVVTNGIPACTSVTVSNKWKVEVKEHKDTKLEKVEVKEHKDAKAEIKEHKDAKSEKVEKVEVKEHKDAKAEIKEHKDAKTEKIEVKEVEKPTKDVTDHVQKPVAESKLKDAETVGTLGTTEQASPAGGSATPPLAEIADSLAQSAAHLRSFIQASERPPVGEEPLRKATTARTSRRGGRTKPQ
jgi:hypothetical protein